MALSPGYPSGVFSRVKTARAPHTPFLNPAPPRLRPALTARLLPAVGDEVRRNHDFTWVSMLTLRAIEEKNFTGVKKENGFFGHLVLIPKIHSCRQRSLRASIRYVAPGKRAMSCVDAFLRVRQLRSAFSSVALFSPKTRNFDASMFPTRMG